MSRSKILDAALDYARRGWEVFPVPVGTKRSHKAARHCDGIAWGKTRDHAQIRWDFGHWPDANVGIACGPGSDLWVMEIDTPLGHAVDGVASMNALIAAHGLLPLTLMAELPSGSIHYYWRWPVGLVIGNSVSLIGPGIDVRGAGGFVVAPPSVRKDGVYKWQQERPIAHAPDWLIGLACSGRPDRGDRPVPAHLVGANTGAGVSSDPADTFEPPSPEKVAAALDVLDPDCGYGTWMRIGAACKHHQDLFVEWSSRGSKFPGERECRQRAAEFAMMTAITVATLFHFATEADPDWQEDSGCE